MSSHGVILTLRLACCTSTTLFRSNSGWYTYTVGQAYTQTLAAPPICDCALFSIILSGHRAVLILPPALFAKPVWQTDVSAETIFGKTLSGIRAIYCATHGVERIVENIGARRMVWIGLYVAIGMTAIRARRGTECYGEDRRYQHSTHCIVP